MKFFSSRLSFYALSALISALLLLLLPQSETESEIYDSFEPDPEPAVYSQQADAEPELVVEEDFVSRNATFANILAKQGVPYTAINEATSAAKDIFNLNKIQRGARYTTVKTQDGALSEWRYPIDPERTLRLVFGEKIEARLDYEPFEWRTETHTGAIQRTLYDAFPETHQKLVYAIAEIFAWEVDFHYDLRRDDKVEVVYESAYKNGEFQTVGKALAARLTLSGKPKEAFLYRLNDKEGYYDKNGASIKKQFLKMPLKFGRLVSGFSHSRLHPIFRTYRPHYGVDYAAPRGTPVLATADGAVLKTARGKGEGNYVKIRHANGYETMYLHLSRFAKGVSPGKRVSQGQTIGYVGATGYATGPHIDYRMLKNGKYVNPRKIVSPPAQPIPQSELARFREVCGELERTLNGEPPPREPMMLWAFSADEIF